MFDLLILGVIVALMLASHRLAYDLGREDGYEEAEAAAAIGARLRELAPDTFDDRVTENIIGPIDRPPYEKL